MVPARMDAQDAPSRVAASDGNLCAANGIPNFDVEPEVQASSDISLPPASNSSSIDCNPCGAGKVCNETHSCPHRAPCGNYLSFNKDAKTQSRQVTASVILIYLKCHHDIHEQSFEDSFIWRASKALCG